MISQKIKIHAIKQDHTCAYIIKITLFGFNLAVRTNYISFNNWEWHPELLIDYFFSTWD